VNAGEAQAEVAAFRSEQVTAIHAEMTGTRTGLDHGFSVSRHALGGDMP
jgi:hypothetical protein